MKVTRMSDIYVDRYGKQWLAYHDPRFDHTMLRPEYADTDMATFTFEEVEKMHGPLTRYVKGFNEYVDVPARKPETLETEVERLRKFVGKTRQIVDQIGLMAEDRSKHPDVRLMAANAYGDLMHVYYELVLPPTLEGRA